MRYCHYHAICFLIVLLFSLTGCARKSDLKALAMHHQTLASEAANERQAQKEAMLVQKQLIDALQAQIVEQKQRLETANANLAQQATLQKEWTQTRFNETREQIKADHIRLQTAWQSFAVRYDPETRARLEKHLEVALQSETEALRVLKLIQSTHKRVSELQMQISQELASAQKLTKDLRELDKATRKDSLVIELRSEQGQLLAATEKARQEAIQSANHAVYAQRSLASFKKDSETTITALKSNIQNAMHAASAKVSAAQSHASQANQSALRARENAAAAEAEAIRVRGLNTKIAQIDTNLRLIQAHISADLKEIDRCLKELDRDVSHLKYRVPRIKHQLNTHSHQVY